MTSTITEIKIAVEGSKGIFKKVEELANLKLEQHKFPRLGWTL